MPNGVNLSGNYDWFYEGFALYQSLKLGVALNRLRFDDFLDTLARAYTIDALGSDRRSLIGASAARVKGADTQIYARGMLVAFLTDLALLRNSGGKTGIAATLQKIFQTYRHPAAPTEGNKAVLEIIALPQIARTVTGDDPIDWKADLDSAGIEAIEQNSVVRLRVISKPDGRQRKMLDRLGYNNWRKLPITVK
jgi:hypothetical protein